MKKRAREDMVLPEDSGKKKRARENPVLPEDSGKKKRARENPVLPANPKHGLLNLEEQSA
jgi:hypothetical protein